MRAVGEVMSIGKTYKEAFQKAIRSLENKELASIPIFAMTANAFEEDKQTALRSGMNGHIAKPIDVEKLLGTVNSVLRPNKKVSC